MTKKEWVEAWLGASKKGKEFAAKEPIYATQLTGELRDGLRHLRAVEGVGLCDCSGLFQFVEEEKSFYLGTRCFMRICPKCDVWGVFPTAAEVQRLHAERARVRKA